MATRKSLPVLEILTDSRIYDIVDQKTEDQEDVEQTKSTSPTVEKLEQAFHWAKVSCCILYITRRIKVCPKILGQ